jgi:hypothetical protein
MTNYVNQRGINSLIVGVIFTFVACLVVLLRLWVRVKLVRFFGPEDILVCFAAILNIGFVFSMGFQLKYGMGLHFADIDAQSKAVTLQVGPMYSLKPTSLNPSSNHHLQNLYGSIIAYYLSLSLLRLSLLVQYYRIFPSQSMRRAVLLIGAIALAFGIETVLTMIFFCNPVAKWWDQSLPGFCVNRTVLWYFNSIMHILIDAALVILPLPVLGRLEIPRKQKRLLVGVFSLGFVAVVDAILRMRSLAEMIGSEDLSYFNADLAAWSASEINLSLICACLPALRPVVSRMFPNVFGTSWTSRAWLSQGVTRNGGEQEMEAQNGAHAKTLGSSSEFLEFGGKVPDTPVEENADLDRSLSVKSKCWSPHASDKRASKETVEKVGGGDIVVVTDVQQQIEGGSEVSLISSDERRGPARQSKVVMFHILD